MLLSSPLLQQGRGLEATLLKTPPASSLPCRWLPLGAQESAQLSPPPRSSNLGSGVGCFPGFPHTYPGFFLSQVVSFFMLAASGKAEAELGKEPGEGWRQRTKAGECLIWLFNSRNRMLTPQLVLKSTWGVLAGKAVCRKTLRAAVRTSRLRGSVNEEFDAAGLHSSSQPRSGPESIWSL